MLAAYLEVAEAEHAHQQPRPRPGEVGGVGDGAGGSADHGRLVHVHAHVRGGGDGDHADPHPGLRHLAVVHDDGAEVRRDEGVHLHTGLITLTYTGFICLYLSCWEADLKVIRDGQRAGWLA